MHNEWLGAAAAAAEHCAAHRETARAGAPAARAAGAAKDAVNVFRPKQIVFPCTSESVD